MSRARDREEARAASRAGLRLVEGGVHPRTPTILQRAGNAAVTQALRGNAPVAIQRELASLDPRLIPESVLLPHSTPGAGIAEVRPKILAWLEPQRAEIENRALFTGSGFSPDRALSMPQLIAMVREHVPESRELPAGQIADVIRSWSHVQIPERRLGGAAVTESEVKSAVENVLGKPGTVRVERSGSGWIEITAGGIEIGRDDRSPVDATMTVGWDGSVGASLSAGNVKGSFQISPDRTWQAQIAIPAGATVAVLNQISNVFSAADHAASSVAGRVDAAGGKVHGVAVDVLRDGLSPVKDAIDTLSSVTDKENAVSVGVTASGDFQGGFAVQATVTIRF